MFSGLEDSGSDTSEEDTEGVAGASGDEDNHRAEETSEEPAQVGEGRASMGSSVCEDGQKEEVPALLESCPLHTVPFMVSSGTWSSIPHHTFEL